jgi:site-specific DNA recombinase
MKAVAYFRVSPSESKQNETIENQRNFCLRYCENLGIDLGNIYEDDQVSGEVPMAKRPAGSRMLEDAAAGLFDTLLIYKIDRLGRNQIDSLIVAQRLREFSVQVMSMTEPFDTSNPMGQFFFALLAGKAQMERTDILERTALGKAEAARKGQYVGGVVPYGYRVVDRRLEVDPPAAGVVRRVFALCLENVTPSEIARRLNNEGVPAPRGGEWTKGTLNRIVKANLYTGQAIYRKFRTVRKEGVVVGRQKAPVESHILYTIPPILTPEEFAEVQTIRSTMPNVGPRKRVYDYLLTGLLRCGHCGGALQGCSNTSRGVYAYYRCESRWKSRNCGLKVIRAQEIEEAVWEDCRGFIENPGEVLTELQTKKRELVDSGDELRDVETALAGKEFERERVVGGWRRGVITDADLETQLSQIAKETTALSERRDTLRNRTLHRQSLEHQYSAAETLLTTLRGKAAEARRREVVHTLTDSIIVSWDGAEHHLVASYIFSSVRSGADTLIYVSYLTIQRMAPKLQECEV